MNIKILKATLTHVEDFTFVFCESWKVAYKNILSEEEIEKILTKKKESKCLQVCLYLKMDIFL